MEENRVFYCHDYHKGAPVGEKGYVQCPICGFPSKIKVEIDTELYNFPMYCQTCKREIHISTRNNKRVRRY